MLDVMSQGEKFNMEKYYKGSCLCGGVTFEANGFNHQAANCHCSMCRKFHGSAFGTLVGVSKLNWLSGTDLLKDYIGHNGTIRTFCKECGSSLGFRIENAALTDFEVAIATFDEEIPVKVDAHIYTNYKVNWCEISDQLPQYGEGRMG
jgi:hypothetical protein